MRVMLVPRRISAVRREESGFTLVESVIALFVAAVVFGGLASVLVTGVKASLYGRQNQQATDLMIQKLEQLRRMDFASLGHVSLASDPGRLSTCAGGSCIPVEVNGATLQERVVVDAGGGVATQTETVQGSGTNNTRYTVTTYITRIDGQSLEQAKRATVFISWTHGTQVRSRSTSTVIAYSQRGLPLPVFKLQLPEDRLTLNRGAEAVYELSVVNQGAPDRWNIELGGAGRDDGWTLYADTDEDGDFDPTVDQALADTTSDGTPDTGRIDPSASVTFFLVRTIGASEALASRQTTITATSFAQPLVAGAAQTVTATTVVVAGAVAPAPAPTPTATPPPSTEPAVCPVTPATATAPSGSSLRQFTLHNDPTGSTTAQAQLYMSAAAADEVELGRYSTDVDAVRTGRVLVPTSTTAPADATVLGMTSTSNVADWTMQLGKKSTFGGNATVRVFAARADSGTSAVGLKAVLYRATASGSTLNRTVVASSSVSLATLSCAGWQEAYLSLTVPTNTSINKNEYLGVRIVPVGSDRVRLAYDVPTTASRAFPSTLTIGVK